MRPRPGASAPRSSMKSPRWESSSSPIGVSSETGSCETLMISRTFSGVTWTSWPLDIASAISSTVGSRPSSWSRPRETRISRLIVSTMWTGMRIVRAWSAMARVMAWRIHHVAYVENLKPFSKSNFSTARIRPMLPSWMRSRNDIPRPMYFFAIDTTNRRLAEVSCSRASRPIATISPLRSRSFVVDGNSGS